MGRYFIRANQLEVAKEDEKMKNYFKLELKFFFHDRKNQVIFIVTFFASLFYA